jgi:hypothetical protein
MSNIIVGNATQELGFYFDQRAYEYLMKLRHQVLTCDFDGVILVDGYEGYGKSCFDTQLCFVFNKDKSRWHFITSNAEFFKAVDKGQKGDVLWIDEARRMVSTQKKQFSQPILDKLSVLRDKNMFLIWTMPTFMRIDAELAVWRSRCLFHVWSPGDYERGYFKFYDPEQKRKLYFYGKQKHFDYGVTKPLFLGKFIHHWCIPKEEYKDMKAKSLSIKQEVVDKAEQYWKKMYDKAYSQRNVLIKALYAEHKESQQRIANRLGCSRQQVTDSCSKTQEILDT